ncbi:hypothetical protein BLNAU_7715 [Blattamonas nauphoetae]|uniref:Uncharacterized protein n=1 Tax=Blattamonas nauphoetae TaxID=2049346 RepID=A0ABQ9Y0S3_9EUKA|nr:hypothetical protein BLNAU_7715 [Blattamonas nauphoetae]
MSSATKAPRRKSLTWRRGCSRRGNSWRAMTKWVTNREKECLGRGSNQALQIKPIPTMTRTWLIGIWTNPAKSATMKVKTTAQCSPDSGDSNDKNAKNERNSENRTE